MITKNNIGELKNIIDEVSSMIEWVSDNTDSSKRVSLVKELVASRRKLKRIYGALSENPTIAAYGESQQGKSYIISSLLSAPSRPLRITDDNGNKIDFIENINMKSDKQESTGVVTRFTTSDVLINKSYPVKLHLLGIADFITILADSYMNDITGYEPYGETDLKGFAERYVEKYIDSSIAQNHLTEDEIADIEEYLMMHNKKMCAVYKNSGYFDVISTIIRKVPETEWNKVFSPLWKEDPVITKFFELYRNAIDRINYSKDVYVSIKTVLNDWNDGAPTLMCVRALDGLKDLLDNGLDSGVQSEVLLQDGSSRVKINKSLLSAMTAEAVYNIDDEVLGDEVTFETKGIRASSTRSADENKRILKEFKIGDSFKKEFLKGVDLLDFPGARGRDMGYQASEIQNQIVTLLLRCKVSYLFNKYSEDLKLSILMFCHAQGNTTPNLVAPILNSWVNTYIGDTQEKRKKSLERYGISPLFLVSTMYNLDLMIKRGSLDTQIWQRRLKTILYKEVIDHESNKWFDEWLAGQKFDNTYLLRDYFYSSDQNEGNKLFKGYPEKEVEEYQVEERSELKEVFLNDDAVKLFFPNPEVAWNVASTIGNDGSYYMLKRLAAVSEKAALAREKQFNEDMVETCERVYNTVKGEFKSTDETELLLSSINSARRFDFTLSRACEKEPDFFGKMIQYLQVNSNFVASLFTKALHSDEIVNPSDPTDYDILVRRIEEEGLTFDQSGTEEAYKKNFGILKDVFGIYGPDDPILKNIDVNDLFRSTYKRNCSPSVILASNFIDYWCANLKKPENSVFFTNAGFDGTVFSDFIHNFTNMISKAKLVDKIAVSIKEYVDYSANIAVQSEELIADIAASVYNSFVMNLGYDLLSEELKDKAAEISERFKLTKINNTQEDFPTSDAEQLEMLFNKLEALNDGRGGQLLNLPAYKSMRQWISYVFMSYTIAYDVVGIDDVEKNNRLGEILDKFNIYRKQLS